MTGQGHQGGLHPVARERRGPIPSVATDGTKTDMYYVYILKSFKDKKLYIGYTANLRARLAEHIRGNVDSTKHRRPFKLIYYEAYANEEDAKKREKSFKHSGSVYNGLIKRIKRSIYN